MDLSLYITTIPDFPKPWVSFKDISPLLTNPDAFGYTITQMAKQCTDADVIVGLDARGFLFGAAIALHLHKPFVMIRKAGKLPGEVIYQEYNLEYGSNILTIQKHTLTPWQSVAIIDDVLATGGTARASCALVEQCGCRINSLIFLMELWFLDGRKVLDWYHVESLLIF